jgi:hypothetical protein
MGLNALGDSSATAQAGIRLSNNAKRRVAAPFC